ncbi:hypothetical protein J3F84DRAFT_375030 [Trichoderma pleuroticola]
MKPSPCYWLSLGSPPPAPSRRRGAGTRARPMNRDQPLQTGRHEERRSAETGHQGISHGSPIKVWTQALCGIPLASCCFGGNVLVLVIL